MLKRNRMTKLAAILLVMFVMISMQPLTAQAAKPIGGGGKPPKPPAESTTINYVALGDSIATGTVTSISSITSYVTYFYEYLKNERYAGKTVNLQNLAHDGDRTNELLDKLNSDRTIKKAVTNADVITISIGGNNLMQAAKDSSSLGGYDFSKIDTGVADQGLADFQAQWIPIIKKVKSLNPSAKLIVTTTYNPYNESDKDASLHSTVDSYLFRNDSSGLNDLISNNTSLGYSVASVYAEFNPFSIQNNMGEVTYFYATDFWGTFTRNPHPNETGQNIITNLHKAAFESISN